VLEASARAAVDIPAKIRRSPAKAAAIAGGVGFLALKGPQRVFRAAKRTVRGPDKPLPKSMLPDEIDRALRRLGPDGDRVRGTIERDFAAYVEKAERQRHDRRRLVFMSVLEPVLLRGGRVAIDRLFAPSEEGVNDMLARIRKRTEAQMASTRDAATPPVGADGEPPTGV
jgi:hypothetical protein